MFQTKKSKIALFSGIGALSLILVAAALLWGGGGSKTTPDEGTAPLTFVRAAEGSIASSTLLVGTITAADEQYVYYDPSKGDLNEVLVAPGDVVEAGTPLIRYDATALQTNYDTAVRARDKVGRQIHDLRNSGQPAQPATGDPVADAEAASSAALAQRSLDSQLADLNDAYADAQAAVDKAAEAFNEATIFSNVAGTVVEVNKSVSKNATTSQTIVHIVNQGSLEVKGSLTEYDLGSIAVDQEVKLTSKVYPDKHWTGRIAYISNYPDSQQAAATPGTGSAGAGAKYPFKITFTSELAELKQGFTMNIEVANTKKHILVPFTAVVTEEDKTFVWTIVEGKAKKVEVTLGNADALNQEIIAGLTAGDQVISLPNPGLEDGKEVEAHEETAN